LIPIKNNSHRTLNQDGVGFANGLERAIMNFQARLSLLAQPASLLTWSGGKL
jgi:hypothetical protein